MKLKWIGVLIVVMLVVTAVVVVYGVGVRQKVSDFNTDNPADPANPVNPVTPPVTPPAQPKPVAVGSFSPLVGSVTITKSVTRFGGIAQSLDCSMSAPTIYTSPYSGSAPSVYEWKQVNPATISPSTVIVKWYVQMYVRANFASTQYTYSGDPVFKATWNSSVWTSSFSWGEDELGAKTETHSWSGTGNIYYWEHGSYTVFADIYFEQYNGVILVTSSHSVVWSQTFTV